MFLWILQETYSSMELSLFEVGDSGRSKLMEICLLFSMRAHLML